MACQCLKQITYCLQLASIPSDIFSKIVCPTHTPDGKQIEPYIACYLYPDRAVCDSENIDEWPIVYHGTTLEVVGSILVHGQLLMAGDILCNGIQLDRQRSEKDWSPAIWTNPDRAGAELIAETAWYDNGETQFKVLLRLRHKPGTFTVNSKWGHGEYDLWSTNRRGTLYIEALEVLIWKSKSALKPPALMPLAGTMSFIGPFDCPIQGEAFEVLKLLNIPVSMLDSAHNRCYCSTCYSGLYKAMLVADEIHAIPLGWTRFGLAANPVFAHINDIWKSWPIAFHGCHPSNVTSIVQNRALLIPDDILSDGKVIPPNFQHFRENCYFLSPEVGYASHMWYARPIKFRTSAGRLKYFQTIFSFKMTAMICKDESLNSGLLTESRLLVAYNDQLKLAGFYVLTAVSPKSFERKAETEGGVTRLYDDFSIISQDEMEWYSARRGCTHPYGLLIRTIDVDDPEELRKFFQLPHDYQIIDDPLSFC